MQEKKIPKKTKKGKLIRKLSEPSELFGEDKISGKPKVLLAILIALMVICGIFNAFTILNGKHPWGGPPNELHDEPIDEPLTEPPEVPLDESPEEPVGDEFDKPPEEPPEEPPIEPPVEPPIETPENTTDQNITKPHPDIEILPGFGNFTYHDDGDNIDRPVNVYYYRPDNFPNSDSKVIFTMHGSGRNAVSARDRIVPYADRYNALLIAPEFSRDYYPDADDYNRGFVKDGGGTGNLRARSDWTLLTIEEIFDIVLEEIPGAPSKYSIQGNSGAGQFISRIPLLVPEARFEVAAGSNSGWYTLPIRDELYPNGIGDLDITDEQIEQVYSKKVVTVVGEEDTDPDSYQLKHNDFTDAQGNNRYERALFYHDYMRADAEARGVSFNWDIIVVEEVGHPAELMAHAAAGAVFAGATTPPDMALSPIDDTYVDESNPSDVFGAGLELNVDGGNQEIAFLKFDLSSVHASVEVAMLKLYITNGADGKQYIHEVADNSWTESDLSWNNAPALGKEIGMTTGGEKEGILYVEVTDYINENIGGLVSLAFQSEDTDSLCFSSAEAGSFPAQLDLFTGLLDMTPGIEHYYQYKGQDLLYYVPLAYKEKPEDTRVLFVVHGSNRNYDELFDRWLDEDVPEKNNVVLVTPHFDKDNFPRYQRLNVGNGERADLRLIEIFNKFNHWLNLKHNTFYMYGFSGGGQFTHRFTMAHPEYIHRAVAGGSGVYTFPDASIAFSHGLDLSEHEPIDLEFDLKTAYLAKMSIMIGQNDTERTDSLSQSEASDAQGLNRLERAQNFIDATRDVAEINGRILNWSYLEVPDVGHSSIKIRPYAINYLFG